MFQHHANNDSTPALFSGRRIIQRLRRLFSIESNTIQTQSGQYFDFRTFPRTYRWNIEDIAHALSNLCRFNGHCREFYSVAQHSVLCSYAVAPEHAFAALMHEAAEAFVGDMESPLKRLNPEFRKLERRIEASLFPAFGLPAKLPRAIKTADLQLRATEQRDLLPAAFYWWPSLEGVQPLPHVIDPWLPCDAYAIFIHRYEELKPLHASRAAA